MKDFKIQSVIAFFVLAVSLSMATFAADGPLNPRISAIQTAVQQASAEDLATDLALVLGENPTDAEIQAAAEAIQSRPDSNINTPAQLSAVLQQAGVPANRANAQAQTVMTAAVQNFTPVGDVQVDVDAAGVLTDSEGNTVPVTSESELLTMTMTYVKNQLDQGGTLTDVQQNSVKTLVSNSLQSLGSDPSAAEAAANTFVNTVNNSNQGGNSGQKVSDALNTASNDLGENDSAKDTVSDVASSVSRSA